jgi:hypothetical protein
LSAPSLLLLPGTQVPACCDDEEWKPIPDWPHHEASTCGRVRSVDRLGEDGIWRLGAMLPQHPDARRGQGYLYVHLRDGKRRRKAHVAHCVLEAHDKPKPGPGYEACHGNGRTDNHRRYLRWDTKAANLAEMWEQRRCNATLEGVTGNRTNRGNVRAGASQMQGLPGLRRRGAVVTDAVTGDASHGTGSPSSIPICPSVFPSVQPLVRTLRTSFRSVRIRQAA